MFGVFYNVIFLVVYMLICNDLCNWNWVVDECLIELFDECMFVWVDVVVQWLCCFDYDFCCCGFEMFECFCDECVEWYCVWIVVFVDQVCIDLWWCDFENMYVCVL